MIFRRAEGALLTDRSVSPVPAAGPDPTTRPGPTVSRAPLLAAAVFLVALNLRPAITAVGPVLPMIGAGEHLGEGALGVLGALPLVAFGVASPLVPRIARPLGVERAIGASLLLLALGCAVRSYAGILGLWLGTAIIGSAIAVGNVLVPVLLRDGPASAMFRAA